MACDALGIHLVLAQAEKDAGRSLLAEKFTRDAMPRIRMHFECITSGDKLTIEKRVELL
jgi:hypothetical protein